MSDLPEASESGVFPRDKSSWGPSRGGYGANFDLSDRDGTQFLWNKWGAATAAIIDPGVYACVSTLSEEIASADWRIVDNATGKTLSSRDDVNTAEPVARLFHDISEREDGISPFYIHALMLYTTGEAYWQIVTNRIGQITALDWLNSLHTDPDYPRGVIEAFTYSGADKYMRLPVNQMLYDRMRNNLLSDFHGFGPVMVAIGSNRVQIVQAAGQAAMSYFKNDGMPYAAVAPTGNEGDKAWDEKKQAFIARSLAVGKSARGKFRTIVFPYPFDAHIFEQPDVKKWADLLRAIEPDIYRAFRVPPPVVGDVTTPYQNSDENRKNYHATIAARLKAIAAFYNTNLVRRIYGRGTSVSFEFELTPYQHIDDQERQAARDLYDRGLVEGNELRVAYGWQEVDWLKGKRFDPANQILVAVEQPTANAAPALAAGTPDTDKGRGAGSFCVALDIGSQPDLIALQQRVKAMADDAQADFEANTPESFHVTLAYVPEADDATTALMLDAVKAIPAPDLALPIGSLRAFDTVGKYALHFRIRSNAALRDYQAQVAEAITDAGGQLSAFSDPDRYIPHITMGYTTAPIKGSTFQSSLTVPAKGVVVWRGDDTVYRSAEAQAEPTGTAENVITPAEATDAGTAVKAVDEFDAFLKVRRRNKTATRDFEWNHIDEETGALIRADLASEDADYVYAAVGNWRKALQARAGVTDYVTRSVDDLPEATREYLKSLAENGYADEVARSAGERHYARVLGQKALSSVRSQFEAKALALFKRALDEARDMQWFKESFEGLLFSYARRAMLEGYAEGGIPQYELDESDERWLIDFNANQRAFIADLARKFYADNVLTMDEVQGKPAMWWNLSVNPAYNEGMMRASKDGVGVFYNGPTSDKCIDCRRLQGQARRFSVWRKYFGGQLVPCGATECGGFNCQCEISPRQTAVSRGALPRLHGYRKAVLQGVDMEVYDHAKV